MFRRSSVRLDAGCDGRARAVALIGVSGITTTVGRGRIDDRAGQRCREGSLDVEVLVLTGIERLRRRAGDVAVVAAA